MRADGGQHVIVGSDGAAFATARAAVERGYDAVVYVPRGAPSVRTIPADIRARDFDPREKTSFTRAFNEAVAVYYCCGTASLPIDDEEPVRLARMVEAAGAVHARFVYCDAPYGYGVPSRAMSEEMPQRAKDPVGTFLTALSQFVIQSHRAGTIDAVMARHTDLIGPQVVRSQFGEQFMMSVLLQRPVSVLGRANAARSLTYTADLGRALVLLAERSDTAGQLWHLPSTQAITPERLVALICAIEGIMPPSPRSIHEIRSRESLLAMEGGRHKAQHQLARFYESKFVFSSAKYERAFGLHASDIRDLVQETVGALTPA